VKQDIPRLGQAATLVHSHNRYPYVVVHVSPNGHRIELNPLATEWVEPAAFCDGLPVFSYIYSRNDLLASWLDRTTLTATLHKDGSYRAGKIEVQIGQAEYCRDFSDRRRN